MGWSDLPSDLVISIAAHLWEAGDYLRFRAVCRSWKSSVGGFRPSFFPWLAAIPCNGDHRPNENELSFISHVANNRVFKSKSPAPRNGIDLYGSHISNNKDGWMMFMPEDDGVAIIFNPLITGAQLQHLPSLYTCFGGTSEVFLSDHNLFAFANANNTPDDGRVNLVAAAPGDDTWSVVHSTLPHHSNIIKDVVFHEADHKFYAVHRNGNLLAFCLTRCHGSSKTVVGEVSTLLSKEEHYWDDGPYLVSYGTNLLQVGAHSRTKYFEILKYCPDAYTWIEMTNIGNNSLFVDLYGAKLLPLPPWGDQEGRPRRNCIYNFRYEYQGYIYDPPYGGRGPYNGEEEKEEKKHVYIRRRATIQDVSKGIVEPCFSTDIKSHFQFYSAFMWFMPSLSINN